MRLYFYTTKTKSSQSHSRRNMFIICFLCVSFCKQSSACACVCMLCVHCSLLYCTVLLSSVIVAWSEAAFHMRHMLTIPNVYIALLYRDIQFSLERAFV